MSLTNLYTEFSGLVKSDLLIGEVLSVGTETSELEDPNGYSFIAIGTSVSIGDMAFVKAGIIQSTAPTLPASEVLV